MSSVTLALTHRKPSWLHDPLDIITLMGALKTNKCRIQLSDDRWFKIIPIARRDKFNSLEPLFHVSPEIGYAPMGFFSVKELQSRLDKM